MQCSWKVWFSFLKQWDFVFCCWQHILRKKHFLPLAETQFFFRKQLFLGIYENSITTWHFHFEDRFVLFSLKMLSNVSRRSEKALHAKPVFSCLFSQRNLFKVSQESVSRHWSRHRRTFRLRSKCQIIPWDISIFLKLRWCEIESFWKLFVKRFIRRELICCSFGNPFLFVFIVCEQLWCLLVQSWGTSTKTDLIKLQ